MLACVATEQQRIPSTVLGVHLLITSVFQRVLYQVIVIILDLSYYQIISTISIPTSLLFLNIFLMANIAFSLTESRNYYSITQYALEQV